MAAKRGPRNKYVTHVQPRLKQIGDWCRDGLIEAEIAKRLGVAMSSFSEYKKKYPELLEILKEGKEEADYRVQDALYNRALGYDYEEEHWVTVEKSMSEQQVDFFDFTQKNPDATDEQVQAFMDQNRTKMILEKRVKKRQAPDTTAAIFWLKNRKPKEWRDKHELEHSGGVETNQKVDLSSFTTDQLRKLVSMGDSDETDG